MYQTLFKWMAIEEWRLHTEAFGTYRFALFPVQIFLFAAAVTGLITLTPITIGEVVFGIHVFVLLFGLHTGTAAFEGRDVFENVLGDITYILFSTRTLPVSQRRLFTVFITKDIVYYAALFIAPITLGVVVVGTLTTLPLTALGAVSLLISLTVMFVFGAAIAVVGTQVLSRTPVTKLIGLSSIAAIVAAVILTDYPVETLTPYTLQAVTKPLTLTGIVVGFVSTTVLAALAVAVYDTGTGSDRKHVGNASLYESVRERLTTTWKIIAVKALLDLHRSNGGVVKPVVSGGILTAAAAFILWSTEEILGITLNAGIAFAALLGLTAFTTFTWLTKYDDITDYVYHPVSVIEVFYGKYAAFACVTVPIAAVFYAVVLVTYPVSVVDAVLGAGVVIAVSTYVLGVLAYLSGIEPETFMFDTTAFAGFAGSMIIGLVPIIIFGLVSPIQVWMMASIVAWSVLLVAVGIGLVWLAPGKWKVQYRVNT